MALLVLQDWMVVYNASNLIYVMPREHQRLLSHHSNISKLGLASTGEWWCTLSVLNTPGDTTHDVKDIQARKKICNALTRSCADMIWPAHDTIGCQALVSSGDVMNLLCTLSMLTYVVARD